MTSSLQSTRDVTKLASDRWWHLSFGILMAVVLVGFSIWSLGYVGDGAPRGLLFVTILLGLFMAFNIGGNDVANSFGTSVGAGTLTIKQALMVAGVFEVSGAVLAGGEVTDTVRKGIVDLSVAALEPLDVVFIMMSALLGASVWLLIATRRGLPVSTTHAIIGGIVGAAITVGITTGAGGFDMVQWDQIGQIAASWVLSPVLGGTVSAILYGAIKRNILVHKLTSGQVLRADSAQDDDDDEHEDNVDRIAEIQVSAYVPERQEKRIPGSELTDEERAQRRRERKATKKKARRALERWVPALAGVSALLLAAMLLFKGLGNIDLAITPVGQVTILVMVGFVAWVSVSTLAKALRPQSLSRTTFVLFSWMQVFTAAAFAFSHGSNDIANAIGPFVAVLDVLRTGTIHEAAPVPFAVLLAAGIALVVGLWFIGRKVIATVGTGLTQIHPASGFAAELAASGVVLAASVWGLPVSSTHILIGAVLGVGLVNRSANWRLMKPIGLAWIITLPAAALISAVGVLLLRAIF